MKALASLVATVKAGAAALTDTLAEAEPLTRAILAHVQGFVVRGGGIEVTVTTAAPAAPQEQAKPCPRCGRP